MNRLTALKVLRHGVMPNTLIVLLLRLANVGALVLAASCVSAQVNVVR
jgi:hypothetical protein